MKKQFSVSKVLVLFLICVTFLFTSCGKDKTIEKIIYGDSENSSKILSREDFNSTPVLQEFNSFNDFKNYLAQCSANKTNIFGKKFKIKDSFELITRVEYFEDYYYGKYTCISDEGCYFYISFVNTDLNSNVTNIEELVFIVDRCFYTDYENYTHIEGYSYL